MNKLSELRRALRGRRSILILSHDNPDPDALSTAATLSFVLLRWPGMAVTLGYGGVLGRAENQEMVRRLGLDLVGPDAWRGGEFDACLLVDSQPGFGNNSLPTEWCQGSFTLAVVDHHPLKADLSGLAFHDVRPTCGATATIATEYLRKARLHPDARLATALFYGIKTETQGLTRATSEADLAAYLYLEPRVDRPLLSRIEHAPVPGQYFVVSARAFRSARRYADAIVAHAGELHQPDMLGELADSLMRLEGAATCLCTGFWGASLLISVRSRDSRRDAGKLAQRITQGVGTGGGHPCMGGGQLRNVPRRPATRRAFVEAANLRFLAAQEHGATPGLPLDSALGVQAEAGDRNDGVGVTGYELVPTTP